MLFRYGDASFRVLLADLAVPSDGFGRPPRGMLCNASAPVTSFRNY